MKMVAMLLALTCFATAALADDPQECATGQGTYISGTVTSAPIFKHGKMQRGAELSHTHITLRADQDQNTYDVAIDNVFTSGYDGSAVVPSPLNTIAANDRLSVCGQPFPGGIHWVHTDCGDAPTSSSPDGFVKKIDGNGQSGPNMEGNQKYCYIFGHSTQFRATMKTALRANLVSITQNTAVASAIEKDDYLPDPTRTPGVASPDVTQTNINQTICVKGWAKPRHPASSYTTNLKRQQMNELGLSGSVADYEEDHLISIELGGDPTDPRNLWPEPWNGSLGAHVKDKLENRLNALVCNGELTLEAAQRAIATNWIAAYCKYMPDAASSMPNCVQTMAK